MIALLLIVLICTFIGHLVGQPLGGLAVGTILAALVAFANSPPQGF